MHNQPPSMARALMATTGCKAPRTFIDVPDEKDPPPKKKKKREKKKRQVTGILPDPEGWDEKKKSRVTHEEKKMREKKVKKGKKNSELTSI